MLNKNSMGAEATRVLVFTFGLLLASACWSQLGLVSYLVDQPRESDLLGSSVAVLDWNGDGVLELVVGRPGLDLSGAENNGGLFVSRVNGEQPTDTFVGGIASCEGPGFVGTGALMGSTLAVGDFNGDDISDLAVGMPRANSNLVNDAGAVCVIYGAEVTSLSELPRLRLAAELLGTGDGQPASDFGAALATGDLNGDGFDELAIGWPGRDMGKGGAVEDAGVVLVMLGSAAGLQTGTEGRIFLSHIDHPIYSAEDDERFGSSLAIGPFVPELSPFPQFDDLMVGVPFDTEGAGGGSVYGYRGDGNEPLSEDFPPLYVGSPFWNLAGTGQANDGFGQSMVGGDFDGDNIYDLAVGIPGDNDLGLANQAGAVMVLYGPGGLFDSREQVFFEASIDGHPDGVRAFDRFGEVLAAGDFDQSGHDDLAIGSPLDNVFDVANAGEVTVLYGSGSGLSVAGSQVFAGILFGESQIGSEYGAALAVAPVSGDLSPDDLLIGIPLLDITVPQRHLGRADASASVDIDQQVSGHQKPEPPIDPNGGLPFLVVDAGGVRVVRSQGLFSDGFEAGTTAVWSSETSQ